ncbi:RNA ligase family protein [Falsirhodobacter sp. 20TX0035]|uniref:RNA ligase family protein n=1 Tax=Falsirhodobacter sp. 20TX0035 TaxID=3022019 RepID=UPI002FE48DB9
MQAWDRTLTRFEELGIPAVPTLYRGPYRPGLFEDLASPLDLNRQEGFVVRIAGAFPETAMPERMGKYVRPGHVQSEVHWMKAPLVPNVWEADHPPVQGFR